MCELIGRHWYSVKNKAAVSTLTADKRTSANRLLSTSLQFLMHLVMTDESFLMHLFFKESFNKTCSRTNNVRLKMQCLFWSRTPVWVGWGGQITCPGTRPKLRFSRGILRPVRFGTGPSIVHAKPVWTGFLSRDNLHSKSAPSAKQMKVHAFREGTPEAPSRCICKQVNRKHSVSHLSEPSQMQSSWCSSAHLQHLRNIWLQRERWRVKKTTSSLKSQKASMTATSAAAALLEKRKLLLLWPSELVRIVSVVSSQGLVLELHHVCGKLRGRNSEPQTQLQPTATHTLWTKAGTLPAGAPLDPTDQGGHHSVLLWPVCEMCTSAHLRIFRFAGDPNQGGRFGPVCLWLRLCHRCDPAADLN